MTLYSIDCYTKDAVDTCSKVRESLEPTVFGIVDVLSAIGNGFFNYYALNIGGMPASETDPLQIFVEIIL